MIECKYKTRNYPANSKTHKPIVFTLRSGTQISLANHLAQNNGYYDSWSNIQQIEEYVENGTVRNGFFILLTNDWRYWDGKTGDLKTAFDGMYMHDGLHKVGERRFADSDKKDHGGRADSKTIKNDYLFRYTDYHYTPIPQQGDERYLKFKYLIVSVGT